MGWPLGAAGTERRAGAVVAGGSRSDPIGPNLEGRAEQTSYRVGLRRDGESSQWGLLCSGNHQTGRGQHSLTWKPQATEDATSPDHTKQLG